MNGYGKMAYEIPKKKKKNNLLSVVYFSFSSKQIP